MNGSFIAPEIEKRNAKSFQSRGKKAQGHMFRIDVLLIVSTVDGIFMTFFHRFSRRLDGGVVTQVPDDGFCEIAKHVEPRSVAAIA